MWSSEPWVQHCSAVLREDGFSRWSQALSEFNPKIHVLPLRTPPHASDLLTWLHTWVGRHSGWTLMCVTDGVSLIFVFLQSMVTHVLLNKYTFSSPPICSEASIHLDVGENPFVLRI